MGISPQYVLHGMSINEAYHLLRAADLKHRQQVEQHRDLSYYTIIPHLKKKPSMKKLFPLPWDTAEKVQLMQKPEFDKVVSDLEKLNII